MKKAAKRIICTILAIVLVGIAVFIAGIDHNLTLAEYTVASDKITEEIKILLLADLHSCIYGENQQDLLDMIDAQSPDIIVLAGDIIDDEMPEAGAWMLFAGIAGYPCYYVIGNHELWSGESERMMDEIRGYGVTVLEDWAEPVTVKGQEIIIAGMHDPAYSQGARFLNSLASVGEMTEQDTFFLLLSHRPEYFETYQKYDFDLVLSGHAHGGQWRLPGLIDGLYAPNQGLFPKWAGGMHEENGTTMIVSRGLARESTRLPRVYNPPEVVVISLVGSL